MARVKRLSVPGCKHLGPTKTAVCACKQLLFVG
jgi:hypothetical protein